MHRARNTGIRVGLRSQLLPCGCTVGIYETYRGEIVAVLDAKGPQCRDAAHVNNGMLEGVWGPTPPAPTRARRSTSRAGSY
jgi:hypothetical protein